MSDTKSPTREELLKLAAAAVERMESEKAMLTKMCQACVKVYNEAWAERMAKRMVELGESELPI